MTKIEKLKEIIFNDDNNACFIERELILNRLSDEMRDYKEDDKYAIVLSRLLSEVSTPVYDCDYFAGRVVQGIAPDNLKEVPNLVLCSTGHMSYDYELVLKIGLKGILKNIKEFARENPDNETLVFAKNSEIVINAIRDFAKRYSKEAHKMGFFEMEKALKTVPYEPAYDLYSALQGIWLIHLIGSCYVGSRDYAFGRFDSYLQPYYEISLKNGKTKEELTDMLCGFFIKTNEICGLCTYNYKTKPILCHASKQYVNIGGENPCDFSSVVLEAAVKNNMAQPQITVLLKPNANEDFTNKTFWALSKLVDKLHIYNYNLILNTLRNKGFEDEIAKNFTFSACCTFDLNYHNFRLEHYVPAPKIFSEILHLKNYSSVSEIMEEFKKQVTNSMQLTVDNYEKWFNDRINSLRNFVFDGLFLTDSAKRCRYAWSDNDSYKIFNAFCPGIATIGDSLMVLDKLVFKEKRFTYSEFMKILKNNYEDFEELRNEILNITKFGNDTDADIYSAYAGNIFLDGLNDVKLKKGRHIIGGFYSLERENTANGDVSATPNGRKNGEPFSENQSPTYGTDKNGITSLLNSISKLPFERTATGGLNLTFSNNIKPEILKALCVSYFEKNGLHIGISVVNSETLKNAMKNPDKYKTLTVRLYGFSEYFVSLPKWQQEAILKRTTYGNEKGEIQNEI